ncbi:MAG: hypothetical protein WBF93_06930, partial [Pirellulales bacterium]
VTPARNAAGHVLIPLQKSEEVDDENSDIPTGHLAWAVFVPKSIRIVDSSGTLKEVGAFTLPFRHFGDVTAARNDRVSMEKMAKQAAQLAMKMEELAKAEQQLAKEAKAEGVLPVRVEIPMTGQVLRYEQFLVVNDAPKIALTYRRKLD